MKDSKGGVPQQWQATRADPSRAGRRFAGTLAVVLLGAALAACAQLHPEPPVVVFRGVTLRDVALSGATLDVALQVKNPNPFNIDVQRVTYQLFADSTLVGTGQPENALFVPAKDSAIITLPVAFTFRALGNVAFQLVARGSVNYRLTGQVSFGTPIGTMTRDFDQRGTFNSSQIR